MLALSVTGDELPRTELSELLTGSRRRTALALLANRSGGVSLESLATQIAAIERDEAPAEIDAGAVDDVRLDLRHRHLPRLVEAGLLTRFEEPDLVAATDHPVFENRWFQAVLDRPNEDWDDVVDAISSDRRRRILATVERADRPLSRAELARRLADETDDEPSTEAATDLRAQLHHVHLPKLDDAGLITYDQKSGTVTDTGDRTTGPLSVSA